MIFTNYKCEYKIFHPCRHFLFILSSNESLKRKSGHLIIMIVEFDTMWLRTWVGGWSRGFIFTFMTLDPDVS